MRTFYIYKVTDTTNGKLYIGCTKDFEKRKASHLQLRKTDDCLFHQMIEEHGKENFEWVILETVETQEEAYRREQFYIRELNTIFPDGYNMTIGGRSHSLVNSKPIVSLTLDGQYVKRYVSGAQAVHDDGYVLASIHDCCKGLIRRHRDKVFMYEEDYLKNGSRIYEKPEPNGMVSVIQCDMQGNFIAKFKSVNEASEKTGTCRTTISGNLTGEYKTANGFIFVYEKDYPIKDISKHIPRKKGRRVAQVNPETNEIIEIFDRMADAGRKLNVSYKGIHKVVDDPKRTAYGFKWISQ